MIDLTPLDVRKKKGDLRRAVRGYEPAEVDGFLDLVADRLEELVRENRALSEEAGKLREDLARHQEKERALTEALVTAQSMREDLRRQADKDAELVRREAEVEAARIRDGAVRAREREEEALRRLRARREQFLSSYRTFLEREMSEIAVIERAVVAGLPEPEAAPSEAVEAAPEEAAAPVEAAAEPAKSGKSGKPAKEARPVEEDEEDLGWLTSIIEEEQA